MKGKRVIAGLLAGLMFIVPIQVRAEEVSYNVLKFTDMNDLTVSVPASLPLTYSNGVFSANDTIQVSGTNTSIAEYSVDVSLDTTNLEYVNENDSSAIANGVVTFGEDGIESWDKDEVASSTGKDIAVEVSSFPQVEGKYTSSITYTIDVTETLIEDVYFTKTVDDDTMTCEITGLTDAGKTWVISEVTSKTRAVDVDDTTKAAGELKIPSILVVNGKKYTVTSIGDNAFNGNTDITSVTMADSVTKLGYSVFEECSNLVTCQLSDNITDMGQATVSSEGSGGSTFWKCTSLTTVNIPSKLSVIPRSCFGNCSALQTIEIPANNIVLGHQAFAWTGLTSIDLPEGTTFAGSVTYSDALGRQFYSCKSLKSVSIPSSVTYIPYQAFTYCTALTDVSFVDGVKEIGYTAFTQCTALKSFDVPETCEKIYNSAFESCTGLTSFSIPIDCDLTDMSNSTSYAQFTNCKNIKTVTITKGRTGVGITDNYDRSGSNDYRVPWSCGQSNGTVTLIFEEGVSEIASGTFNECNTIKAITIPSTVTSIADSAIAKAYYVRDLYWNANSVNMYYSSLNSIGKSYTGTTLHIGDNITSLNRAVCGGGDYTNDYYYDQYKKYINYIDWGNSQITEIKAGQFCGCDLYEIDIPSTVTYIGTYAFRSCGNLKTLSVPSSVSSLGNAPFYFCDGLKDIYWDCYKVSRKGTNQNSLFPHAGNENTVFHFGDSFQDNDVTSVPEIVLTGTNLASATSLYSIELKTVDWGTFKPTSLGNALVHSDIYELEIPDSVTHINNCAVYGGRTEILHIANTTTSIGAAAFGFNGDLSLVYYGDTEDYRYANLTIDEGTAVSATNETLLNAIWIYTGDSNQEYKQFDWTLDSSTGTATCIGLSTYGKDLNLTEINIPQTFTKSGVEYTVTSIADEAFKGNTTITSVTMPDTVTSIGELVFSGCTKLVSCHLSESLASCTVGSNNGSLFYNCTSLTTVNIPASLTVIPANMFKGCSKLTSITIPSGVTEIQFRAFQGTGITELVIPDTVTTIGTYLCNNCTSLTTVTMSTAVTEIKKYSFYGCSALTTITGTESVQSVGDYAFYNCTSLTGVSLSDSTTNIGEYAFYEATALKTINLADSISSIGQYAFYDCKNVQITELPSSLTKINQYTFYKCMYGLKITEIPEGVTSIGTYAFYNCNNINSLVLPTTLTSIGSYAFRYNYYLVDVTIPNTTLSIGTYAFYNCTRLADVYYLGTADEKSANLTISSYNTPLTGATWHYNEVSTMSLLLPVDDAITVSGNDVPEETEESTIEESTEEESATEEETTEEETTEEETTEEESTEEEETSEQESSTEEESTEETSTGEESSEEPSSEEPTTEESGSDDLVDEQPGNEEPATEEESTEEETVTLELQEGTLPIESDSEEPSLGSDDLVAPLKDETSEEE